MSIMSSHAITRSIAAAVRVKPSIILPKVPLCSPSSARALSGAEDFRSTRASLAAFSARCYRTQAPSTNGLSVLPTDAAPQLRGRFPLLNAGVRRGGTLRPGSQILLCALNIRCYHTSLHQRQVSNGNPPNEPKGQQKESPTTQKTATIPVPWGPNKPSNSHLSERLPSISQFHRPSREELLAAATGFWSRLKVRFKWFSIRSVRPFNVDEIGAFFSWILLGHVLWIILGTTTFFSLAIFAANTVFAQETLARWVGNYITKSSGVRVIFESAIVPKWGDGVITFKNVFVSKRPGQRTGDVKKGSPDNEAAAVAAAIESAGDSTVQNALLNHPEDANFTQFDLSIGTVNVTLSFRKWFNGKGLLRDVEVKGVRGVIDRSSVHYDDLTVDPRSYRHEHSTGDFEIDSFKMEDLLVTVHQPGRFRPFPVSIYNCELSRLRRQWLFYDFLSANVMSGCIDDSLFAIHPAQMHVYPVEHSEGAIGTTENSPWEKQSRLHIMGLNIDHLNRGVEGPFSWIYQGNVDIIADIKFPVKDDESIARLMADFYDRMEATVTSRTFPSNDTDVNGVQDDMPLDYEHTLGIDRRFLVLDLKLHLNDIRAAVPMFTHDLSYVNNALIRPIVAFMNSRKTFIPINCRVIKRVNEFDGSWTVFDSGLMDDMSAETYKAFAQDVADDQARFRRFKKVGLWSLQLAAQAFFMGLAGSFA